MKKLLLHVCCAPCLSGADKALSGEGFDITGYFYNPNIHPQAEFIRRIEALRKYSDVKKFNMIIDDSYDIEVFKKEVVGKPGDRCRNCYMLRLEKAACYARQNNYDCFSSTLLISPYQKHEAVNYIGQALSQKYGVEFYYRDLRTFYRDSVSISKELGLYRQKYCGCSPGMEVKNEQVSIASA
ncbi:MAG: epoxyqueuosine reductase QueH [bacterium]